MTKMKEIEPGIWSGTWDIKEAVKVNSILNFFASTNPGVRIKNIFVPSNTPGYGRVFYLNLEKDRKKLFSLRFKYTRRRFRKPEIEWIKDGTKFSRCK